MRGLRSFLALLVVAIALGGYLYFVESKRDPFEPTETRPKVFSVESGQISEVTIKADSGERTTVTRSGDAWQITSPAAAPADAAELSGIATNLSTLEEGRLIEENPGDLAEFGLAEPRIEVAFKADGSEQRLLIGNKTPTGADIYAKTSASPKVFLIASYLESTFNRKPFDLRDKSALAFDRDNADAIDVTAGTRKLRFEKANGEWQIAEPAGYRADGAAIEGLLARLNTLQMRALAEGDSSRLAAFGLDKPAATVVVRSGSSQATLLVGGPAGEGTVYAKDTARPTVFTVDAFFLEDLQKDAGEYRQKDIFDARAFNTSRVEITRGGETFVFEKTDDKWQQTAPAAKEPEAGKVESLLSALTAARAESFSDRAPSGSPELTAALTFGENRQERISFYRSGDEVFATRDGSGGAATLDTATLDGIVKAVEDLR